MQYNNMLALFDNWDMYSSAIETSANAMGTLQQQQDTYMESAAAHLTQLRAQAEEVYADLFDADTIISVTDAITKLVDGIDQFIKMAGGGKGVLLGLGAIGVQVFSNQINKSISQSIINFQGLQQNTEKLRAQLEILQTFKGLNINDADTQVLIRMKEEVLSYGNTVTEEEHNMANSLIMQTHEIQNQTNAWNSAKEAAQAFVRDTIEGQNKFSFSKFGQKEQLDALVAELNALSDAYKRSETSGRSLKQNLDEAFNLKQTDNAEKYASAVDSVRNKLDQMTTQTRELISSNNRNSDSVKKLEEAYWKYQAALNSVRKQVTVTNKKGQDIDATMVANDKVRGALRRWIDQYTATLAEARNETGTTTNTIQQEFLGMTANLERNAQQVQQSFNEAITQQMQMREIANVFTQFTSGLGQLAFAGTQLKNIWSTLKDDDAGLTEKIGQIAIFAGTTLPMLAASWNRVKEAITSTTMVSKAMDAAFGLSTNQARALTQAIVDMQVQGKININVIKSGQLATMAHMKAQKELGISFATATRAQRAQVRALTEAIMAEMQKTGSVDADTIAENINTDAVRKNILAHTLLNPALIGTVVAIGAIGTAIYAGIKAYNADADAAKEAAEAAKGLKDRYTELKESYDELKNSLSKYQEAKTGLDELIRGTDEWKEKLEEVNNQVLDLLEQYPKLSAYVQNVNGVLTISEAGQQEFLKAQREQVNQTLQGSRLAQINSGNKAIQSQITDFSRLSGINNQDIIRGIIDAVNTGDIDLSLGENAISNQIMALADELNVLPSELNWIINGFRPELRDLIDSINANTESNKILTKETGKDFLEGTTYEDNEQLARIIGADLGESVDKYMDQYAKRFMGRYSDKWIRTQIVAQSEGLYTSASRVDKNTTRLYKAGGEYEDVDTNVLRAQYAMNVAQKELEDNLNTYTAAFDNINNSLTNVTDNVKTSALDLISGVNNLGQLTYDEVTQLLNIDLSTLSDEDLSALGTDRDTLDKQRQEAADAWIEAANKVSTDLAWDAQEAFKHIDLTKLTLEERQTTASIFNLASAYGLLNNAVEAYNNGTLDAFAEELHNFIKKSTNSYAEISKIIDGLETGDTISAEDYEKLDEASQSYFALMLDGTYKLIGSAKLLKDQAEQTAIQSKVQENARLGQTNQLLTDVSQSGYELSDLQQAAQPSYTKFGITYFEGNQIQEQINLVRALGDESEETQIKINTWQQLLNNNAFTKNDANLKELADTVASLTAGYEDFNELIKANTETQYQNELAIALSQDSLKELRQLYEDGTIHAEAFNNAAYALDQQLDLENLDPDELKDYAEYLQEAADAADGYNEAMSDVEAEIVAKGIMKMNDAIDELADNWEDWSDILQNSTDESEEYSEALENTREVMSNLLDVSKDFVSEDFILQNFDKITAAATGSAEAIDELKALLANDIIANIIIQNNLETEKDSILASYNDLINSLSNEDIQIGATFDDSSFIAAANALIEEARMTVDQVNALFDAIGFETTFVTQPVKQKQHVPIYVTETVNDGTRDETLGDGSVITWRRTKTITYQDGSYDADGYVDTMALTTNGKTPQIKGITKKATGSASNYSSLNKGGKAPGKSSGKSGSGKEAKKEDYLKKEIDRYHDINLAIDQLDHSLRKLQKDQDKLMGDDLLNNLNTQLDILEQQKAVYENKIKLEREEADELRNSLSAQGVQFGAGGGIENYTAALQAKLDYVNSVIDQYNAMSADEQEGFKDTLDAAKQGYDDFKDQLDRYNEIMFSEIPDLEDQIAEALDAQIEINIKKFTAEVELRLDMDKAERDFNEFRRKVIKQIKDDDILGNAQADLKDYYAYFNTANTGIGPIQALTEQVDKTIKEIGDISSRGFSEIYGKNSQQALEDLDNYYTELMSKLEDMEDLSNQIKESYLDMIGQAIDEFDEHVDQYNYINDLLNHDLNLIGLLYGDDAYEDMDRYYRQIQENDNNTLDFLRKRVDYAREMMNLETDPEARKKWQEEWQNSLEELNEKVEDAVENIIDKYSNTINQVFDALDKKVTDGLGLDYVGEEWDLINANAERYLDNINAMQAVQELENKYLQALDDTDNLSDQQKIRDVMGEQLDYLREKDKLTQYDVDRANMIYELTLKQIALETAQQSKTNLRLRRDSQGNYTYQYVSDADEVAQKQQELQEAQNDLYNFDKNRYIENLNDLYDIYKEFQDKLKELYLDPTIEPEERLKRQQLLTEQYEQLITGITTENVYIRNNLYDSAFDDLAALYQTDVQNFKNMSQAEKDELMNSLVPQWDSSLEHMAEKIAGEGGLIPVSEEAFSELSETTVEYEHDLSAIEDAADITFSALHTGLSEGVTETKNLMDANDALISKYKDGLIPAIQGVIGQLDALRTKYEGIQTAAENAATAAHKLAQAQREEAAAASWDDGYTPQAHSNIPANVLQNKTATGRSRSDSGSSGSGGSGGSGSGYGGVNGFQFNQSDDTAKKKSFIGYHGDQFFIGDLVEMATGKLTMNPHFYTDKNAKNEYKNWREENPNSKEVKIQDILSAGERAYIKLKFLQSGKVVYTSPAAFDTGGYTGDWSGAGGRAAILHEKELVLNQTDTKNILSAVGIVRHMDDLINNLNTATNTHMANLTSGIGFTRFTSTPNTAGALDQHVQIEANFPGVRDAREIEEALNNLVNAASMHAFNNRR